MHPRREPAGFRPSIRELIFVSIRIIAMKPMTGTHMGIALARLAHSGLRAAEPVDEIPGLQKTAADFVTA